MPWLDIALQVVDLDALRELAWSGVPSDLRPTCWQLLLGYLPPNRERRCPSHTCHPLPRPESSLALPSSSKITSGAKLAGPLDVQGFSMTGALASSLQPNAVSCINPGYDADWQPGKCETGLCAPALNWTLRPIPQMITPSLWVQGADT